MKVVGEQNPAKALGIIKALGISTGKSQISPISTGAEFLVQHGTILDNHRPENALEIDISCNLQTSMEEKNDII